MHTRLSLLPVMAGLLFLVRLGVDAAVGPVQGVSVAQPNDTPSVTGTGDSLGSLITPDGAVVVFVSGAPNLTSPGGHSGVVDVYVRHRTNGVTTLVSANHRGTGGGNRHSTAPSVTFDGRYVAFVSEASDLVTDDTNGVSDVFIRDLATAKTARVSAGLSGGSATGASTGAVMTPDGRFVAFVSDADDLVSGDTNGLSDIFLRELQMTGVTTRVSGGLEEIVTTGGGTSSPVISTNGQVVAFVVLGAASATPPANGEVYVRDLPNGTLRWASSNSLAGLQAAFGATAVTNLSSGAPALSDDGRWLTFHTQVSYRTEATTNWTDANLLFRLDLEQDVLQLVCTNAAPLTPESPDASGFSMSPDGTRIAYTTRSAADAPGSVLCWEAATGTALPVSANRDGALSTSGMSHSPTVSPEGRFVAFLSEATDLVTNPVSGGWQVYLRDLHSGQTRLVSVDQEGAATGHVECAPATLSAGGRWIAFDSPAANLVSGDRNQATDVFVRDTETETTELVSAVGLGLASGMSDGFSYLGANAVNADGRVVVFTSLANNLVDAPGNGYLQVYARDREAGTNILVSVASDGNAAHGSSHSPAVSANGRYVAFVSRATNLAPGVLAPQENVYVRDLATGTTELASVNRSGAGGNGVSSAPSLSADGRRVAFQSLATDLAAGDTDPRSDIFVRDLDTGTTECATDANSGLPSVADTLVPVLSPDGRFVVFTTSSFTHRLVIKDLQTGALTDFGSTNVRGSPVISGDSHRLVVAYSVGAPLGRLGLLIHDLIQGTGRSVLLDPLAVGLVAQWPSVSLNQDGRYVAFSWDAPLETQDTNATRDVFVFDAVADNLTLVSVNAEGSAAGNGASDTPSISADGRFVAFDSHASDLVIGDRNDEKDVFLHDRASGQTTRISAATDGAAWPSPRASHPWLNGALLVFLSLEARFGSDDFNSIQDLFACPFTPDAIVIDPHPEFALAWEGSTTLVWNASPGRAYRVQYTENLANPAWTDWPGTVTIVGAHAWIHDASRDPNSQRFYRVRLVE